jgi:hypothetical protein
MNRITRRDFLGLTATGVGSLWVGEAWSTPAKPATTAGGLEALYQRFLDPDHKYSIRPFWFWNGKLDGEELGRQIRQMVEHGVFGAYAHNRDGLQTPYLSEDWWQAVGAALKAAREEGFSFCIADEFEWPSGEARDYWLPGINKSRVVAANPEFRMKRLRPSETPVSGPKRAEIPIAPETAVVVVAKRQGPDALQADSLRALTWEKSATSLAWEAPPGDWLVMTYTLEPTQSPDGGTVDLMSAEAVRKFIETYYEEFYRRYGEYFGNTFVASFADHEGSYGGTLGWTPRLFETFARQKQYRLERYLPGLKYDIGSKTEKVRCDYLDVISELYCTSFFQQVNDWCRAHHLEYSGHVWEESLFFGPWVQGDFYRILRALGKPGCDSLVEWGRQSVWLKEVASVADFEGRRMVCENQGVQGGDSYLSPERMRRVSNALGAWNVSEFIPHAFDYDLERINFPPDWFRSQPFLPWFRAYADQMRRISFMNSQSHHVADLLLYYPQVSIWGQAAPALRGDTWGPRLDDSNWSPDAGETNFLYALLKLRLSEERFDYKVADDLYLAGSRSEGNALAISTSRFRAVILPPMSTLRRATAERLREFFRAGGTVIAWRRLPAISAEDGRDDAQLKALWDEMFDRAPGLQAFTLRSSASGGGYFVPGTVDDLLEVVRQVLEPDLEVLEGPREHLWVLHKQKDGFDFYWVVNDTDTARTNLLRFRAAGKPERWDAPSGQRAPLFYQSELGHTRVRLALGPWDAAYVVFDPAGPVQPLELKSTNLEEFHVVRAEAEEVTVRGRARINDRPGLVELSDGRATYRGDYRTAALTPLEITGEWTVSVEPPEIPVPYARVSDDPEDRGMRQRWYDEDTPGHFQSHLWLSPMNASLRQWNVLGPFPNPGDRGLDQSLPPEQEIKLQAVYEGEAGRQIRWHALDAAEEKVEGESGWDWPFLHPAGGPFSPSSNIVDYGKALRLGWPLEGTCFAQTFVYVPEAERAVVVLATGNPAAVWMNDRKVYSRWLRPLYNELTDGFAARIPVQLNAGWNNLLLKFLHNPTSPRSGVFTCRVERGDRGHIKGLVAGPRQFADASRRAPSGYRWLRFPVPPVARALRVPPLDSPWMLFVDGKPGSPAQEIPLPPQTRAVTLRVVAGEILDRPFAFLTGPSSLPLGTWSFPGLEHFSGLMTYEKTVDVPASLLAGPSVDGVELDCGRVGVVAQAWVNGAYVGARPWQPFVFDVTQPLRPGANHLRVRVANTEANARAVGTLLGNLKNIDLNGWLGPARLVPYFQREIRCRKV